MLVLLHDRLAIAAILYLLVLGLWGLVTFLRGGGVSPGYRGSLVIGEGLLVAQAVVGVALLAAGGRPLQSLHYLYGILVPLILPAVWGYARARPGRQAALYYGVASLFVFGLAVRALMTGA